MFLLGMEVADLALQALPHLNVMGHGLEEAHPVLNVGPQAVVKIS